MTNTMSSGTLNLTQSINLDWICWQRFAFIGIVSTWNWIFLDEYTVFHHCTVFICETVTQCWACNAVQCV